MIARRHYYIRRTVTFVWVVMSVVALAAMAFGVAADLPALGIVGTALALAATLLGVYEIARAEDERPGLHEWQCPGCGTTVRAKMADHECGPR